MDVSKHLFGLVLTPVGVAANNRGETEGNITTLQKVVWKGQVHTTVSAEAIRMAIRRRWQEIDPDSVNRRWDEAGRQHEWRDRAFSDDGKAFLDDDVLGFMSAEAARSEANPAEGGRSGRARGKTEARRARLEVTRAISIDPWAGDVTFNAASPGATPSAAATPRDPVPYGTEVHSTRYQYGFALTPDALQVRSRAATVLDALVDLAEVAGNHARFLFDFSPQSLILRYTDDPAPRFLYAFEMDGDGQVGVPRLRHLVDVGDVDASELWLAGEIAGGADARVLEERGAHLSPGIKAGANEVRALVAS